MADVYSALAKRKISMPVKSSSQRAFESMIADYKSAENQALATDCASLQAQLAQCQRECEAYQARIASLEATMTTMATDHQAALAAARAQAKAPIDTDSRFTAVLAGINGISTQLKQPSVAKTAAAGGFKVVVTARDGNGYGSTFDITPK